MVATSQERWHAENLGKPSEDKGTSRDISANRREASQLSNKVVLYNAQHACNDLGVLMALVYIENKARTWLLQ